MTTVHVRVAGAGDARAVAALHADSWRRHYRGAYADAFLDADVMADRHAVWSGRLEQPDVRARTIVAETPDDGVVGFAHSVLDDSPEWGALLDNLHVAGGHQRRGVGAQLMSRVARFVADNRPGSGLYLWVLQQNANAQRFYDALGGRPVEAAPVPPVGGVAGRLNGSPLRLRYSWPDPTVLVQR